MQQKQQWQLRQQGAKHERRFEHVEMLKEPIICNSQFICLCNQGCLIFSTRNGQTENEPEEERTQHPEIKNEKDENMLRD